ncbi:hypothetical protein COCSUDRAFT_32921 [Coccomyxa subellipsoidea C-169]|uniref:Uncharacterized protein n=1 Tax=Coccomyxa subellipsoidea (strain C-169) TaxID=574566 RepID=I0Z152_COCSC|nr:hypothetical protein COCSUDRAFT_32921 [Coccomyxa subellipsoidea C-169]EIE24371.1 hypothetical protein COCSUDRAFT_32921 [Coccomyxa subellipsoidea C-169]|eukprot:XP_005648915.1 hypothetical protein COCSUDRAFT_32921 [Coccomyxa subellipsoidea C-169]
MQRCQEWHLFGLHSTLFLGEAWVANGPQGDKIVCVTYFLQLQASCPFFLLYLLSTLKYYNNL